MFTRIIHLIIIIKLILISEGEYNSSITNQSLTNIFNIGEENSRFIDFASYSNGTIIIEVSSDIEDQRRIFFGLKSDGNYLFEENEYGIHQIILLSNNTEGNNNNNNGKQYSENFIVLINEKEYLVSVPNGDQYTELYDFENSEKNIYKKESSKLIGNNIISIRHSSSNLFLNGSNYIVFQSLVRINNTIYSFRTNILEFLDKNIEEWNYTNSISYIDFEITEEISPISMTSCFVSKNNYIWTMGFKNENNTFSYYIIIYSPFNLSHMIDIETFEVYPFDNRAFYKIVHLKDDIGVAVFYSFQYNNISIPYPSFIIRQIEGEKLINYLDSYYNESILIDFHNISFNYDCLLNDLIRISDFKISFITMDINKEILYIILLEIYSPKSFSIKLYKIDIYNIYNIKFYNDIREHLYNQLISFGFNYCNKKNCENINDTHYTAFLIFGYPNSTNEYLNLSQYLEINEGNIFDNITIDLKKNTKMENNIFGYVYSHINIIKLIGCDDIILKSTNENNIYENYELLENEEIKISFKNQIKSFNCTIYYKYVITDINYTDDKYYFIDNIISNDFNYEEIQTNNYSGKISFYNIIFDYIEPTIPTNLINQTEYNSSSDYLNEKSEINTEQKFTENINEVSNEAIPKISQNIQTQLTGKIPTNIADEHIEDENTEKKEEEIYSDINILINKIEGEITETEDIKEIFNQFSKLIDSFDYNGGYMKLIQNKNVNLQLILFDAQYINLNSNISIVDIGECESILKSEYDIPESYSLILLKSDIKNKDLTTKVSFDLYNPFNKIKLNMSYCDNVNITMDIPINLENNIIDIYESLTESGFNLFDSNDPFYNDICSIYTSLNGTDMILSDRQNIIYKQYGIINLCQPGCNFTSYNKTTKIVQCDCNIKSISINSNITDIDQKESKNSFTSGFFSSNFKILKCVKIAFDLDDVTTNKGRLIMTFILIFYCIVVSVYAINNSSTVNENIKSILNDKLNGDRQNTSKNNKYQSPPKKPKIKINSATLDVNMTTKKKAYPNFFASMIKSSREEISKINIISEKKILERIEKEEEEKKRKIQEIIDKELKKMNDEEINSLEYEKAIIYDKRTFCMYYWSILKKGQIILFTFFSKNDYTLFSLKLSLLSISLSLELVINSFFFIDNTMHNIHENKGEFDLLYQIPQILYSSIISTIIFSLLKKFALSEKYLVILKQIKTYDKSIVQSQKVKRNLILKFISFVFISFILMLFFWYYIAVFCGIFINTQLILFKDTLISLLLSMIYPFGLCLFPGICRISALKAEKKDEKYLYKFSGFMTLIS